MEHSKGSLGSQHIVQLLDDFLHIGPSGCHQSLVFELLGPPVNLIAEYYHEEGERLDQGLEQLFHSKIQDPELKALLPVTKGLIRFLPSDRISASQALGLITHKCDNAQRTEVSDDEPDTKDSGKRNEDMWGGDEKQDIKIRKRGNEDMLGGEEERRRDSVTEQNGRCRRYL